MIRDQVRTRSGSRAFTMVEVLVAVAVLSMVSLLLYGAFYGLKQTRDGLVEAGDRHREGRMALARMSRELQGAYLSMHAPINQSLLAWKTAFIGTRGTPADRVDFNTFANERIDRDAKESDQAEVSFFSAPSQEKRGKTDLVRRISNRLDMDPERGGKIQVLATDIQLFELQYLDPLTGQWLETWDTTQATAQLGRLPLQVRIVLVLSPPSTSASNARGLRFVTKVPIPVQKALTFATQ